MGGTYIMILEDGETYSELRGCEIAFVTDEALESLVLGTVKLRHLTENREIFSVAVIGQ